MGETWEPRENFKNPDMNEWYAEDSDFTYITTRKLLQKDLHQIKLTNPNKPLVGKRARAMGYVNGVKTGFYPTIHINSNKAKGILCHGKEHSQRDEQRTS